MVWAYGHIMEGFVVNSPTLRQIRLAGSSVTMNYSASHFSWVFAYNLTHLYIISFLNKIKFNKIGFLCKNRRENRITPTTELKPEMETVNRTGPERIEKKTLFSLCSCAKLITRCTYIFYVNSDQTEYLL